MKRKITFLIAAVMLLSLITQPFTSAGQEKSGTVYVRISSLSEITNGCYVVFAARYNQTATNYKAMKNALSSGTSGKLDPTAFVSTTLGTREILPTSITNNISDYSWTVSISVENDVNYYTFTNNENSNNKLGYGSSTNFNFNTSGNNIQWTIKSNESGSSALVGEYTAWIIANRGTNTRGIVYREGSTYKFAPYATSNNNSGEYLMSIDIFVEKPTYNITYNGNGATGGSVPTDNTEYVTGSSITMPGNTGNLTLNNYEFAGWYRNIGGTPKTYAAGDTLIIRSNTTVYAKWNLVSGDPTMTVSETALSGFTSVQNSNVPSTSQSFNVSGANLGDNKITIALNADSDFEISVDNSNWGNSVNPLVPSDGTVAQTNFYVRMKANTTSGNKSGSITVSCAAITGSSSITLSGTVIPVHTLTYAATNGSIEGVYSGSSTAVVSGASVAEGASVSLTATADYGYRFSTWSDGSDNSTLSSTTSNPTTFTMGNANKTITATFVVDPTVTTSLTGDDMENMENAGTTYGTLKYVTTSDGFYWETNGYQAGGDSNPQVLNIIQLRQRTHGSGVSWIKLPEFNGKIENIVFSVTDASSTNYSTGAVCKGILAFQKGNTSTESVIKSGGDGTDGTKTITLNMSDVCYNTGYIVVTSSKGVRIWNIEVTYYPSQDMTGTSLSTIPNDVSISIPSSTSATATDLTIPASSGIIIKSGATLTVSGTLANSGTAANLVIEDGGQLILNKAGGNPGVQATIQKRLPSASKATNWTTIASPVKNISIGAPAAAGNVTHLKDVDYALYRFNETTPEWENYKNTAYHDGGADDFETLEAGRGYLYSRTALETLAYVGEVNGDEYTSYELTKTDNANSGFHLIGNPYSHDIYKGATGNGYAIPNTQQETYDDNGYVLADGFYRLKNGTEWASTLDGTKIEKGEGILVQATTAGTLRIYNSDTKPAPAKGRANNDNIMFTVANGQYDDVAYALFKKGVGLTKINHRDENVPMIYINQDGEDFAIATMSDDTKSFNLNFKAMTTGMYTLGLKPEGNFTYIHVIDKLTGEDIDMLLEGEYSFIGSPKDSENRFIVRLGYMPNSNDDSNDIFAYQSGSEIYVTGSGELQVFDVTGRQVMNTTINGAESISIPNQGVYIFRLNEKVQKIVVR